MIGSEKWLAWLKTRERLKTGRSFLPLRRVYATLQIEKLFLQLCNLLIMISDGGLGVNERCDAEAFS